MKATPSQLHALGGLIAVNQVQTALGTKAEAVQARAVIAGVLSAAQVLLSATQFRALLIQCEIDLATLAELFEIARPRSEESDPGAMQHFLDFVTGVTGAGSPEAVARELGAIDVGPE